MGDAARRRDRVRQGPALKTVVELDGRRVVDLDGFFDAITDALGVSTWGRNLDAFDALLREGFGTPDDGFVLRWTHTEVSRVALGYPETVRYLERKLTRCHPTNVPYVRDDLEAARRGEGATVFDILVDLIDDHADIQLELC